MVNEIIGANKPFRRKLLGSPQTREDATCVQVLWEESLCANENWNVSEPNFLRGLGLVSFALHSLR